MSYPLWTLGILGLFLGGTKVKNVVEDNATAAADSFTRWDEKFQHYGSLYNVPWWRLKAIAMNESSLGDAPSVAWGLLHPDDVEESKSEDGKSWGLMQMTIPTARDYDAGATPQKLNDPDYSIRLSSQFLASLQRQFDQADERYEEWVVKSYNQGAGNTRKEIRGDSDGFAQEYWERYTRNRAIIADRQGV